MKNIVDASAGIATACATALFLLGSITFVEAAVAVLLISKIAEESK